MTSPHAMAALAALYFVLVALPVGSSAMAQSHCGSARPAHWDDVEVWDCHPMWECEPPRHRWRDLKSEPRAYRQEEKAEPAEPVEPPERAARDEAPEEPQTGEAPARQMGPGRQHSTARRQAAAEGNIPARFTELSNDVGHTIAAISAGAPLYGEHCASCHGPRGQGDGAQAQAQATPPLSLGYVACQPYASDAYLAWTILQGGQAFDTDKPAFENVLSEAQVWQIVAYMRAGFPTQIVPPSRQMDDEQDEETDPPPASDAGAQPVITPLTPVAPARL